MTPVIVAAVSEVLNRPADRVSELRRQRRTMATEARRLQTARVMGDEPSPLRGAPEFAFGEDADREFATNGGGEHPPIKIYGRPRRPPRILHPKVWIATGLAAFAIAAAVLTLPELVFGGSVASSHRTTFFGGGSSSSTRTQTQTTTTTTRTKTAPTTVTRTVPAQTQTQTTTTPTQTSTTPNTSTQAAPSGGTPTPTDTGTSTTPAPSGAAAPPTP